ncbi:hypothetical protein [Rhizomonospora bruguierae]|uniref:hypothetical protein n=1 Tax=Rhizomonospora bruguierae TaxID=1581705 RepID=UPI001BCFF0FA|nr:hypothetical protein [Micromonospora sp. NBRC 107566]
MSVTVASRYVGWLLRSNRRLGPHAEFRSGRDFARAFRPDSAPELAPSQITRWEQGATAAGRDVLRRYEELLGAEPESLVVLSDTLRRMDPHAPAETPAARPADQRRLYDLLDRALALGEMTGAQWSRLTELVSAQPALVLYPRRLWSDLAEQLLRELVISEKSAWLQRQEAISRLLEHPAARPHAVAACVALADDPSSPAVIEPVSLLDVVAHEDGNRYVLRQIENPASDRAHYAGLLAAVRKVRHGHFTGDERARLTRAVHHSITDSTTDPATAPLLAEVAAILGASGPGRSPRRRRATLLSDVEPEPGSGCPAEAHAVSERIAGQARISFDNDGYERDPVLADLVRQALFDPNPDLRLLAGMLIAATPYRDPVAVALLGELKASLSRRVEEMALPALRALTTLGVDLHRPLMRSILTSPGSSATLRHAAGWAIPHCPGRYPLETWGRILSAQIAAWSAAPSATTEGVLRCLAYGVGTDRHYGLLAELRQRGDLPGTVRQTAHWLLSSPAGPPA